MTNEFAIECIKDFKKSFGIYTYDADIKELIVALDIAIEALEQQPSEDCISREAVINAVCAWGTKKERNSELMITMAEVKQSIVDILADMQPVTPQRQKGKWIKYKSRFGVAYFKCSECGRKLNWVDRDDNYCNNCGSDNSESTKELYKEWDTRIAEMEGGAWLI